MCTFDAPIARCETMHQMVLLDETRRECACEHGCPPGQACPLAACFARQSGLYRNAPRDPPRRPATSRAGALIADVIDHAVIH